MSNSLTQWLLGSSGYCGSQPEGGVSFYAPYLHRLGSHLASGHALVSVAHRALNAIRKGAAGFTDRPCRQMGSA